MGQNPRQIRLLLLTAAVALTGSLVGSADTAVAADPQAIIDELLRDGWQIGPDGMQEVRQGTQAARQSQDADAMYAAGLALLRHHQYDDAAAAFQASIDLDKKHFRSWRGLLWVLTLQEKFSVVLIRIEQRLAPELPTSELTGQDEEDVVEMIQALGRLIGFYEGPRSADITPMFVQRARQAIQPALIGKRQTEFDNNYQDVTTLFASTTTEQQDAKDDAKLKEQMEKQDNQQQLEIRRKQIEVDQQQATDQIDRLRSEWTQEEQRFAQLEAPLNVSISQLEAQQSVIRRELAILIDDVFRLTEERRRTNDPVRRDRLEREIFRLERLTSDYERDLALVQAEGRRLVSSRDVLRTRRLQTQQRFEAEVKQNVDRKQDLERAEKRLSLETRRNNRPATGNSAKVRVLSAKTSSIRTYYDFPLEVERLTLLGP